ncbi:MAG: prepilin-type N-terminal cleavage/methylation domain-containing protein [Halofilum sp. (in: g-proteobacteria)]|nr:prepilin-type N-terminal cleavage/methylation domain-containing protein [Halofilum sp. (in: g-proteobacteria)]
MNYRQRQQGFTLVEIAVVLVIIGLLLGGVLKGQELIASARVRNLADQQAGIQAAYFGFIDRYRAVPGDMDATEADNAIGTTGLSGGDANGRLADPTVASPDWTELNAVWQQLAAAGFIKGTYSGSGSAPTGIDDAPINVFNGILILGRHDWLPADRLCRDASGAHHGSECPGRHRPRAGRQARRRPAADWFAAQCRSG